MSSNKAQPRPILPGWTQVSYCRGPNGNVSIRPGYRCPKYIRDLNGNYRRCDISMRRQDHTNDHIHFYRIPPENDKEYDDEQFEKCTEEDEDIDEEIEKNLNIFIIFLLKRQRKNW